MVDPLIQIRSKKGDDLAIAACPSSINTQSSVSKDFKKETSQNHIPRDSPYNTQRRKHSLLQLVNPRQLPKQKPQRHPSFVLRVEGPAALRQPKPQ